MKDSCFARGWGFFILFSLVLKGICDYYNGFMSKHIKIIPNEGSFYVP